MFVSKLLKISTAVFLVMGALGVGTGVITYQMRAAEQADQQKDTDTLEGEWEFVQLIRNGQEHPNQRAKMVFAGDKMTWVAGDRKVLQSTFKLDSSKKPKHIDLTIVNDSSKKTGTLDGIYELDGDNLKLVLPIYLIPARPSEFKSVKGTRHSLVVLKRIRAEKPAGSGANPRLLELYKAKHQAAKEEFQGRQERFNAGQETVDTLLDVTVRLVQSELELATSKAERLAAYERHVKVTKEMEEIGKTRLDIGRLAHQEVAQIRYARLQAEIWLEKEKAK